MRNLDFKYAKAQNFLCFGEDGIEIDFKSYGNIVAIKGRNLDVVDQDSEKASNGSGKCFGENTPILMYDGTIKMVQDIIVGDLVMGNDSTPRRVLSLGRGKEMLYKVTPKKGDAYIVNKSHVLTLKSSDKKHDRSHTGGKCVNISVQDYLNSNKNFKHLMRGYRSGVEFSKKDLLIDPYFLGLWLGDGTRTESSITNMDEIVVKEVNRQAAKRSLKINISQNKNKSCPTYRISSGRGRKLGKEAFVAYRLRKLGMDYLEIAIRLKTIIPYYENKNLRPSTVNRWVSYVEKWIVEGNKLPVISLNEKIKLHELTANKKNTLLNDLKELNLIDNKHIPLHYKTSSRKDRLLLLAGYLDTDGYYKTGGYEFCSKFKQLAEDVTYLARSLGLACYLSETIKSSQNGTKGLYYRGYISGDCSIIPVKINYKKSSKRKINKDPLMVGIHVEPIGVEAYYGFSVDGNHLFLLGDFTVVHNSSIPEVIVYGLYGKTIKKPKKLTHLNLINNKDGKKLVVEVRWDDYRVVRKRDSNNQQTLQLWQSANGIWNKETEISKGKGTQVEIEKIIGLTYESFINIFIFSDDNTHPFLECDGTKKREIVENILSLEKYRNHFEKTNEFKKNLKTKIKELGTEYEYLTKQKEECVSRISQIEKQEHEWHEKLRRELEELLSGIKNKRDELEQSNAGAALAAYQDAQEQIADLKQRIPTLEENKKSYQQALDKIKNGCDELVAKVKSSKDVLSFFKKKKEDLEKLIFDNQKCIKEIAEKTNKECPYCLGVVNEVNFAKVVEQARKVLEENEPVLQETRISHDAELLSLTNLDHLRTKGEKVIVDYANKVSNVNKEINALHLGINELCKITMPDSDVSELLLAEQFENLKKLANEKQEQMKGKSPFETIKLTAISDLNTKTQDCNKKKDEIKENEDLLPYYEFWVKAFGDTGIRKYVIDGIIPTLNDRIEYWLQFLIDNKIKLTFNNELEETIDRYPFNGRPYVYHGMSGGQRRRLNLTVAAAWAFVSSLNSGASPSVIFLDEVTMNVDAIGVLGIYRMICELAKEKQVFVIDHNEALLEMLSGCDSICLEMKDEVSTVVT